MILKVREKNKKIKKNKTSLLSLEKESHHKQKELD